MFVPEFLRTLSSNQSTASLSLRGKLNCVNAIVLFESRWDVYRLNVKRI